jgi:GntR family transcriptional repressor for pyruvate dehydrogenase complex
MSISWDDDVIEQERLHERVARRLARDIVSGRLREGDVVPPAEMIAQKFAVSRTVGREVLQALSAAGLIDVKHGRKSTVTPAKDWRFLEDLVQHAISREPLAGSLAADLYEVRRLVEIAATEMCAVRASDEQLDHIVELAQRMHDESESNDSGPLDVRGRVSDDLAFHGAIAEAIWCCRGWWPTSDANSFLPGRSTSSMQTRSVMSTMPTSRSRRRCARGTSRAPGEKWRDTWTGPSARPCDER